VHLSDDLERAVAILTIAQMRSTGRDRRDALWATCDIRSLSKVSRSVRSENQLHFEALP
jgi:hypothetical protein